MRARVFDAHREQTPLHRSTHDAMTQRFPDHVRKQRHDLD
jgi:hypothetical protein